MALRATGKGAIIRYATRICGECGEAFECSMDTRYHRLAYEDGKNRILYFCRWSCLSRYDKKIEEVEEKRAIARSEAARAQWERWRQEHPQKPKEPPPPQAPSMPRIDVAREQLAACAEILLKAPCGSEERASALKKAGYWRRVIKKERAKEHVQKELHAGHEQDGAVCDA